MLATLIIYDFMADKKTTLMAQFYEECQKKGYTDMKDPTQSLKAKVLATDLKLKYRNIVEFYERAKEAYAVIATGEEAVYANVLLKKGVIK